MDKDRLNSKDPIVKSLAHKYQAVKLTDSEFYEIVNAVKNAIGKLIIDESNVLSFTKFDKNGNPVEINTIELDLPPHLKRLK